LNARLILVGAATLVACTPSTPVGTGPAPAAGAPSRGATDAAPSAGSMLDNADRARQALNRLTFGPRPGDLELVERMGVNAWIDLQLRPERIPDASADSVLGRLDVTRESALEMAALHPQPYEVRLPSTARLPDTAVLRPRITGSATEELADLRDQVAMANAASDRANMLSQHAYAAQNELIPSIMLRSTVSDRQLLEVMTVFWENHFSVSADKMSGQYALVDYDHAIHANALGKFRDLLEAVAKSPAMLFYLDNAESGVDSLHPTSVELAMQQLRAAHPPLGDTGLIAVATHRPTGLNENFARELMELHTLGVDGGYTQHDVQEVARCFTGWRIDNGNGPFAFSQLSVFAFHPEQHDAAEKVVLGVHIPAGRGIEDGEEVLDILARSPSTARFIAKKLVIHFVSDNPPPALVERAAQTYLRTGGDIREVLRTIVTSPEFFSRAAFRAKAKTPFELVASVVRALNAAPDTTQETAQLVAGLGQRIFGHLTPEGWPDQGAAWLNMGALLDRVNFAVKVGGGQVRTITIANWRPSSALLKLNATDQVDGVIAALLEGEVSPTTRDALLAIETPPGSIQHLGELVGLALGSPEFQSR